MGKLFVPDQLLTPADNVREALDEAERMMPNLKGADHGVLNLLSLFDLVDDALTELEEEGGDMRAEQTRFETLQGKLRRYRHLFLSEAGAALQERRAAVQPDMARWWWFLDEAAARDRRRKLSRMLVAFLVMLSLTGMGWFAYDHFLAPPPDVRQTFQHAANGESLVEEGDLQAAMVEFEAAAEIAPHEPEYWMWIGVLRSELNGTDGAAAAFETARSLCEAEFDFLLGRSEVYLHIGKLAAAMVDVEQAIEQNPDLALGYYVRASVAAEQGNCILALADLERARDLAREAGDTKMEASASVQQAMVTQFCQPSMPSLTPE